MRRLYLVLIALGILAFLAVSALLARVFSAEGAERSAITALVQGEARGDVSALVSRIHGCQASSPCQARIRQVSAGLRRPGSVSILSLTPSTSFSLASTTGVARVAWKVSTSTLPVVQCVLVHRAGSAVSGLDIQLLALGPQIRSDADCPAQLAPDA